MAGFGSGVVVGGRGAAGGGAVGNTGVTETSAALLLHAASLPWINASSSSWTAAPPPISGRVGSIPGRGASISGLAASISGRDRSNLGREGEPPGTGGGGGVAPTEVVGGDARTAPKTGSPSEGPPALEARHLLQALQGLLQARAARAGPPRVPPPNGVGAEAAGQMSKVLGKCRVVHS